MSVTALHLIHKKEFEPIVRPMENIAVATDLDEKAWLFYRVKYVEPFFVKYTTATITAGSSIDVDIDALKLHDNVLGQIRITEITAGFEAEVRLPEATKKYSTKNTVTRIDDWVVSNMPHLTEMFYLGDDTPKFTVYNTNATDGTAFLRFVGFKYILERLMEKPRDYTVIYVRTVIPRK